MSPAGTPNSPNPHRHGVPHDRVRRVLLPRQDSNLDWRNQNPPCCAVTLRGIVSPLPWVCDLRLCDGDPRGWCMTENGAAAHGEADWSRCPSYPWPYEPSAPGETLREEMDATGETVEDIARTSGLSVATVEGILDARIALTPDTASQLSRATAPSAQFWLNLQHFVNTWRCG